MTRNLVIIGAGGFAPEGFQAAEDCNAVRTRAGETIDWIIYGCVVFDPSQFPKTIYSYPVLGTTAEAASRLQGLEISFLCMIGDNRIREAQAREAEQFGWKAATLIHSSAVIARQTTIGPGCYVGPFSVIGPYCRIGSHVIINSHVSIGHNAVMDDFSQACPGARINGQSVVGRSALVGSNASLMPGCVLGQASTVGANSFAFENVDDFTTVTGTPARPLFKRKDTPPKMARMRGSLTGALL